MRPCKRSGVCGRGTWEECIPDVLFRARDAGFTTGLVRSLSGRCQVVDVG